MRATLVLAVLVVSIVCMDFSVNAHATSGPSIPTEGGTWANPTITIVINPQPSQPWFKASYSADVSRAISRWAESIIAYTDASRSDYLRKLNFLTYVAGNQSLPPNPDVQVDFIQTFGSTQGLGLTAISYSTSGNTGIFQAPTTTTLATYDPTNATQLTDVDMINIASHEFGHALGLGHATVSATDDGTFELMFLSYGQAVGNPRNTLEAPSTLDLYALSYLYDWLATSSTLNISGHPKTDLSLPSGATYSSVYPYPEQIQMLQNSVSQMRLEILIVAVVAGLLLALVLVFGILLSLKKPAPPAPLPWGSVPTTPPVSGLAQGSTYVFKIDASDPGSQTSSHGPSGTITLPAVDPNPKPNQGQTPKPTLIPVSNTSTFNMAWWMQIRCGARSLDLWVAIVTGSLLLIRRLLVATKAK